MSLRVKGEGFNLIALSRPNASRATVGSFMAMHEFLRRGRPKERLLRELCDIMTVSKRKVRQQFAAISFLILYPVFFFYHAAIAFGYILPVLGGLYGPYSLIVTSLYAISLTPLDQDFRSHTNWIKGVFFIFVGWSLFWASLNYACNSAPDVDAGSFNLANFLIQLIANFAIGCYLSLTDAKRIKILIFVFWICMLVFVSLTFDPGTLSVHGALYYGEAKGLGDQNSFAGYQEFARSTMLTSFIYLAITKNYTKRILITAISTIILFLLSARSELVGFLFAVTVLEVLVSLKKTSHIFALVFLGFFVAIFLLYFGDAFLPDASGSRIAALSDLSKDSSWQARNELLHRALTQIMDNPLFGKFAGEYDEGTGEGGNYAHNVLSAWVSLGLPGFLLYLSLLLGSFSVAMKRALSTKGNSDLWNFVLLTSVTSLLLSFFAKSFFEPWFGLVFGSALNLAGEESQPAALADAAGGAHHES